MMATDAGGAPGSEHGRARGGRASDEPTRHTRWLYARVIVVQVITLVALYLLQAVFGGA